ncbi:MAG: hypothetical protein OXF74_06595 [Rhodobacteraceae bacterium]|nr:hypothetical protein [Paracoccaceae bacterium]
MDAPQKSILLVEGRDDKNVVEKLIQSHNVEMPFSIIEKYGFNSLQKSIVCRNQLSVKSTGVGFQRWVSSRMRMMTLVAAGNQ